MFSRRQLVVGFSSVFVGGSALFTYATQKTKAAEVDSVFNVSNANKDVSSPVQRVDLVANGTFKYETSIVPDSIILRLEAKRGTNYQQLAATKIDSNLTEVYTDTFELTGNLLDLELVSHDDINPADVGNTKELMLDARVLMQVKNNNRTIHEDEASSSFQVQINKTAAQVSSTINSTGDVSVVTE